MSDAISAHTINAPLVHGIGFAWVEVDVETDGSSICGKYQYFSLRICCCAEDAVKGWVLGSWLFYVLRAPDYDRTWLCTELQYTPVESTSTERREQATHTNGPVLDEEILAMDSVQAAIKDEGVVDITIPIVNTDRAFGGRIAGVIANR